MSPKTERALHAPQGYNFGTFRGVFMPSILSILGVVMYLRFGWVLGNVGLGLTLLIVTISSAITLLTGLALSSLATNMRVGGGGAYFLVSRSLGVEAGAAIGLPLFLAQAIGVSFYIAGFSESVASFWPGVSPQVVGIVTLVILSILAYLSADFSLKVQYLVLGAIALSLVSLFLGTSPAAPTEPVAASSLELAPFWMVFAVFFPAVTGILAGVAMSGDLKDPARSLPLGTLSAVGVGFVIYMAIPVYLTFLEIPRETLLTNTLVMRDIARWGDAIMLGLWGATLSSAMGALLGAPRILQALALDRVVPQPMGRGYGRKKDPRVATVITFLIALGGIMLGGLNVIAPVLSMFFLTSYALLNFSAGMEGMISSPSWRPRLKTSWEMNLAAALACFVVMLMINVGATLAAIAVTLAGVLSDEMEVVS